MTQRQTQQRAGEGSEQVKQVAMGGAEMGEGEAVPAAGEENEVCYVTEVMSSEGRTAATLQATTIHSLKAIYATKSSFKYIIYINRF